MKRIQTGWLWVLTVALVSGAGNPVRAQEGEWRQWAGPNGDFFSETTGLAESWPDGGPAELWSRSLGAGHASILVADGRLFTMYRVSHGVGGGSPWTPSDTRTWKRP